MPIETQVQAYQLAITETANAEVNNQIAQDEYQDALCDVLEFLENESPILSARFAAANTHKEVAALTLKDAKKAEADAKAALSTAAFEEAIVTGARKRELHPNINIITTSDIQILKVFQATQWLLDQGKLEDITIKTSKPAWYREHKERGTLPADVISVEEIPLIRIDNPSRWGEEISIPSNE